MAKPPTARQLRYLRALANQTGTTFVQPKTSREASAAIKQMQQRGVSPRYEQTADHAAVADRRGGHTGTAVADDEITGHGSSARWANGTP